MAVCNADNIMVEEQEKNGYRAISPILQYWSFRMYQFHDSDKLYFIWSTNFDKAYA